MIDFGNYPAPRDGVYRRDTGERAWRAAVLTLTAGAVLALLLTAALLTHRQAACVTLPAVNQKG